MTVELSGKRMAVLVADGVDLPGLTVLRDGLQGAAAEVPLLAEASQVMPRDGNPLGVDQPFHETDIAALDGVVIADGRDSVKTLGGQQRAQAFLREALECGKLIVAVGQGPALLIGLRATAGLMLTSAPALRSLLEEAGAEWVDKPVVKDGQIVTSRGVEDTEALVQAVIECLIETQPFLASS